MTGNLLSWALTGYLAMLVLAFAPTLGVVPGLGTLLVLAGYICIGYVTVRLLLRGIRRDHSRLMGVAILSVAIAAACPEFYGNVWTMLGGAGLAIPMVWIASLALKREDIAT